MKTNREKCEKRENKKGSKLLFCCPLLLVGFSHFPRPRLFNFVIQLSCMQNFPKTSSSFVFYYLITYIVSTCHFCHAIAVHTIVYLLDKTSCIVSFSFTSVWSCFIFVSCSLIRALYLEVSGVSVVLVSSMCSRRETGKT